MIQPGLDRIAQLVKGLSFSWKAIHVAGTNGKGSICYNVSKVLLPRNPGVRCGRFTSPHIMDRWDCIWANGKTIPEKQFLEIEDYYKDMNRMRGIQASPFEILTATAFHFFKEEKIHLGIVEVGMGGKLDATNILNNQVVSVISKIAMDHESYLGTTIEEIAKHKAGILRPNVPYVVSRANSASVQQVIDDYAKEIGAGPRINEESEHFHNALRVVPEWSAFTERVPPFQKDNAMLALMATERALRKIHKASPLKIIAKAIARQTYLGRLQYHEALPVFPDNPPHGSRTILIDGAHNPDAAVELDAFVDKHERKKESSLLTPEVLEHGWPVTWVLAMTSGKDAKNYLKTILKPGDRVITTTFRPVDGMSWVEPMSATDLLDAARAAQPDIKGMAMDETGALKALEKAKAMTYEADIAGLPPQERPIVLTGSLYFVADFLREARSKSKKDFKE